MKDSTLLLFGIVLCVMILCIVFQSVNHSMVAMIDTAQSQGAILGGDDMIRRDIYRTNQCPDNTDCSFSRDRLF